MYKETVNKTHMSKLDFFQTCCISALNIFQLVYLKIFLLLLKQLLIKLQYVCLCFLNDYQNNLEHFEIKVPV